MPESNIDVVLLSQCQPGKDTVEVVSTLARLFNTEVAVVQKMMAKGRHIIKRNADEALAAKYKSVIEQAGGTCELEKNNRRLLEAAPLEKAAAESLNSSATSGGKASVSKPSKAPGQIGPVYRPPASHAKGKITTRTLALCFGGFLFVAIIGVLAAIALPAYQEYSTRAKVQSAMSLIHETRNKVRDFIQRTGTYPNRNLDVGLPGNIGNKEVKSIVLEDRAKMVVTLNIPSLGSNNTIEWIPVDLGNGIEWNCIGGSMNERLRPKECRDASNQTETNQGGQGGTGNGAALHQKFSSKDGRLSINVPAGWSRMDDLNEGAALGAGILNEHVYFIVVEEPKLDFEEGFSLKAYTDLTQSIRQEASNPYKLSPDRRTLTIGGVPAEQFTFSGSVDGVKITYLLTTVEVENYFYQIIGWTLASKFAGKTELMHAITGSFNPHSTATP